MCSAPTTALPAPVRPLAAEQLSEWHLHGASGSGGVGDGGGGNQGRMGKRLEISPVGKRGAVVSTCMLWDGGALYQIRHAPASVGSGKAPAEEIVM